ncbi:bZIP transcription factor, bZIP-1 [Niveomyces insectorum RCEF 264]|uniref:BZIP transcription factor, bZIP-1 n=1 Tax=Niveomyces insectorum RCEF 264 TaxID=1081102 RepID=A0A167WXZ9_9HYPO|nr:bZIP transcription factor, bZIP-1 [Niveomyces insectorum RCEF 264]
MVSTYSMHPFYRQAQLSVDTSGHLAQKYFEEDGSILDDAALDHGALDSGLEMSPPMVDSRRDSFALGSTLFSPKHEDWQSMELQSLPTGNPFADHQHSTNPFMRMDQQQQQQQPQQQAQAQHQNSHHPGIAGGHVTSWPMSVSTSANSGVATPTVAHYDGLSADFDSTSSMFPRGSLQPPFTAMGGLFSPMHGLPTVSAAAVTAATASASSVPMQLSSSGASIDNQVATAKKIPPQSPMLRSHNDLRRGDGIRKKNARFDIPAERNLNNIDHLISQSNDEQEIKELKQQKRLLRNRQAALDSRQRKKQHTERLEDEKKHYTTVIADMEQAMERLKLQVAELLQEKQNYTDYIESLNMDKEEMIRHHTNETVELRKKISVLSNHVQVLEGAAAATVLPNHGSVFAGAGAGAGAGGAVAGSGVGPFGDMEGLTMDSGVSNWGPLFPDMAAPQQQHHHQHHQQQQQQAADTKHDMQLVPVLHKENNGSDAATNASGNAMAASTEKPNSQGGLLFMLFLVGAFVLSSRQTPSIPRVSEDVRVASAALLENVLKDAGVPQSSTSLDATAAVTAAAPPSSSSIQASAATEPSWNQPSLGHDLVVEPSMLGQLSDQLIQPTEEQTNEQLFSLTAAQYSGVVHYQHPQAGDRGGVGASTTSQGRRNLAEALAAMRVNSKAEVYTRSLLWDQIPGDVVRTFIQMVAEVNTASPGADVEQ